jgi:hypothetical protein
MDIERGGESLLAFIDAKAPVERIHGVAEYLVVA